MSADDVQATEVVRPRVAVAEAIAAWETKGATSLTVALMAEALYRASEALAAADAQIRDLLDGHDAVAAARADERERIARQIAAQESCASPADTCYRDHDGCAVAESLRIARGDKPPGQTDAEDRLHDFLGPDEEADRG